MAVPPYNQHHWEPQHHLMWVRHNNVYKLFIVGRLRGAPRTNTVFPKFHFQRNTVLQYCVTKIMCAEEHSTNTVFPKFHFQRNTVLQYCVTKIMCAEEHSTNTVFPKFHFQRNTVLQYCVTKIMCAEEHSTKVRGTSIIRCGDTLHRPEPILVQGWCTGSSKRPSFIGCGSMQTMSSRGTLPTCYTTGMAGEVTKRSPWAIGLLRKKRSQ